jgi:hypothetical protein
MRSKLHLLGPLSSNLRGVEFFYYFSHYFLTLVDIAPLSCSANFGAPSIQVSQYYKNTKVIFFNGTYSI